MKLTREIGERIIARLLERIPNRKMLPCVICAQTQWSLEEGFVTLVLGAEPGKIYLEGGALPNVALMCRVCGNTHLLNLLALGLSDLIESESEAEAQPPRTEEPVVTK